MTGKLPPDLDAKKDLILHTYDLFLTNQTRLFVQGASSKNADSSEISRKRELLLLDDLAGFAIAARRLVELTGLKSFANRCTIPMVSLDATEQPYQIMKLRDKTVGFHTLMNRLVHSSIIEHFDNMLDFTLFVHRPPPKIREKILFNRILKRNYDHRSMEQLLFVSTPDMNSAMFSIDDMITQSIIVADKIVETCSSSKIFLEFDMRNF